MKIEEKTNSPISAPISSGQRVNINGQSLRMQSIFTPFYLTFMRECTAGFYLFSCIFGPTGIWRKIKVHLSLLLPHRLVKIGLIGINEYHRMWVRVFLTLFFLYLLFGLAINRRANTHTHSIESFILRSERISIFDLHFHKYQIESN